MANDWASWTISVVKVGRIARQVESSVDMFKEEKCASINNLSFILGLSELSSVIAFYLPIIASVAESVISIPCNFLAVG